MALIYQEPKYIKLAVPNKPYLSFQRVVQRCPICGRLQMALALAPIVRKI